MNVIVILGLLLYGFLEYVECGSICQENFICMQISQCKIGPDESDVLYPCKHKHVCCPKLENKFETTTTTKKYEKINIIKPLIDNDVKKINNTINDNDNSDFNFQYENETPPPFLSIYKGMNSTTPSKNKTSNSSSNDSNGNDNKIDKKNPQIPTINKNSEGIRINIPDFNNGTHHASYTAQNSTNSNEVEIVKRKGLFQKNCGLTSSDNKITGGQVAEPGQFPWMALLGFTQEGVDIIQFLCGGSLITARHILTAAHCIIANRPSKLDLIRLGEYNLASVRDCVKFQNVESCIDPPIDYQVDRINVHPKYNRKNFKNDIAIVSIKGRVRESDYIRTICLPFDKDFSKFNWTGQNFTVSGWGKSSSANLFGSDVLQYAKVSSWDQQQCDNSVPPEVQPLSTSQLCANGPNTQDACKGDSGGPLVNTTRDADSEIRYIQLGVVSFGISTCGDRNLPTIYTRVDKYLDWIVENVT